jgi:prepilin-type N-terminal cleavage/methylation domain-containing protein
MRRTSASCRRADPRRAGPAAGGFTLLELLLVLALVALLTGLVAPKLWQWVQSARLRAGIDTARAELEALPRRAFDAAERIAVDAKGPLRLPDGWRLEVAPALVYEANGMTAGARLRLIADGGVAADWRIEAPAGTVRDAGPDDGPFPGAAVP